MKKLLTVQTRYRTRAQMARAARVGRLLGMTQDEVLAVALRYGLIRLKRRCEREGLDWKAALAEMHRERKRPAPKIDTDRKPMIRE